MTRKTRRRERRITCREARDNRAIHAAHCCCGWCRHVRMCGRKGCSGLRERDTARQIAEHKAQLSECVVCGQRVSTEPVNAMPGAVMRLCYHDDRRRRGRMDPMARSLGFNYCIYPSCKGTHALCTE